MSGKGASIVGGRWNPIGIELIYTAQNRSLAMAETAVHLTLATLPDDYVMIEIHMPDEIEVKQLSEADLPADWNVFPHPVATQKVGLDFVRENKYCALVIPSVATQGDFNVLINPNHPDFSKIEITKIEKFPFDKRIFK